MRLIVVLAILSFITWMSSVHAMHGPVSGCCLGLSNTKVNLKKIKNYTIQFEGACSVTAIVFQTERGTRICSDPQSDWAKKAKVKVDEEKRLLEMEQNTQASTSDFASTVPSTTKKSTEKVDEEAKGLPEMEQNTQASTSDPQSDWAKTATVKVDEEAEGLLEMEQNTQASTSDFPSTVPSTTKKAPVKQVRKVRRRRWRLRSRSGRKGECS